MLWARTIARRQSIILTTAGAYWDGRKLVVLKHMLA